MATFYGRPSYHCSRYLSTTSSASEDGRRSCRTDAIDYAASQSQTISRPSQLARKQTHVVPSELHTPSIRQPRETRESHERRELHERPPIRPARQMRDRRPPAPPSLVIPDPLQRSPTRSHGSPGTFIGSLDEEAFVQCVAFMVEKCANMNDRNVVLPNHTQKESVFFSVTKPDIPTKDYVKRLVTYTQCSPEAFVVMLVYVDRIATENTRLVITSYNMHRILVTALTLACKTLDDKCFSNVHYAKVGGIPTAKEMNRLELQFLKYIKYDLFVHEDTFFEKQRSLEYLPSPSSPVSVTYYSEDVDFDNSPACDSKELCATFQSFSSHPRTSYTQSSIGSSVSHESVPVMAAPVMGNGHGNPRGVTMTVDSRMYTNPKSRSQAYQTHPSAYAMHETRAAQDKRFRRSPEPPGSGRTSRGSPHSRERRNRKESRLNQYRGGNANGQHQFVADFLG